MAATTPPIFGEIARGDPKMGQLEVVEPGLAMFHGFANVAFAHGRGEVLAADTSSRQLAALAIGSLRKLTREPLRYLVYTHGHGDHAFGSEAFLADARTLGHPRPEIWAHRAVADRFARYQRTANWQNHINRIQFAVAAGAQSIFNDRVMTRPDHTYSDTAMLTLAGEPVELHHAMGETDDCTWLWMAERRVAMVGDLVVSSMPNTGNPNKVQRYTLEWAEALEAIADKRPRYVLPGHGPVWGPEICEELLRETARALRLIHDEVLRRLNDGQWPVDIIEAEISLPPELAQKRYLAPIYGCVPFVVRDVLRRYAGWWSGEPSQMFPASRRDRAVDLQALCGRERMIARTRELADAGELKRALALAETVLNAGPDHEALDLNAEVLDRMAAVERSFIARNFFAGAARRLREQLTR